MKKFIVFLFAIGLILTANAQVDRSIFLNDGQRATTDFSCPPGTAYSHQITLGGGFASAMEYRTYDQIETTPAGSITELIFYGLEFESVTGRIFHIEFYHDNAGAPGAAYYSDAVWINSVSLNYGFSSYSYNINPGISVSAGDWISVYAEGPYWYWGFATGGDECVYQTGAVPVFRCDYGDVAFCIGQHSEEIPVSPWAIALGIGLIATAVILRTRRMI